MLDQQNSQMDTGYAHLEDISPKLSGAVESLSKCGHPLGESLARHIVAHQSKIDAYAQAKRNFLAEQESRPNASYKDMGTLPELEQSKSTLTKSVGTIHNSLCQTADVSVTTLSQTPTAQVGKHIEKGGGQIGLVNFQQQHQAELEAVAAYWPELNESLPHNMKEKLQPALESDWIYGEVEHDFTKDPEKELSNDTFER
jgi:hypothetical protein